MEKLDEAAVFGKKAITEARKARAWEKAKAKAAATVAHCHADPDWQALLEREKAALQRAARKG